MTSGTLFIRIREAAREAAASPEPEFLAQWAFFNGRVISEVDAFEPIAAALDGARRQVSADPELVVLLPADRVSVIYADLPKAQAAQLTRAPAYAIEDQLIEAIDQVRVVAGNPVATQGDSIRCAVMAVNRTWLERLESQFVHYGFSPAIITSEASLMTPERGEIHLLLEGSQAVVRAEGAMTEVGDDSLAVLLGLLATKQPPAGGNDAPIRHLTVYATAGMPEDAWQAMKAIAERHHLAFDYHELAGSVLSWLASDWTGSRREAINLATIARNSRAGDVYVVLRRLAAVALIAIAAQAAVDCMAGLYFTRQASALYGQAVAGYRAWLPKGASNAEVRDTLADYLAGHAPAEPGPEVIPFLNTVAHALAASGAAVRVSFLQYRESDKTLQMHVTAESFDAFDQYRRALGHSGIDATIDSLTRKGAEVEGTIHVTTP